MTARALALLAAQSIRRARRSFLLSVFGIAIGIGSLAFFLALSAGARRALERVFPAGRIEVVPASSSLGSGPLSLLSFGGPAPLTTSAAQALAKEKGVRAVHPRLRLAFASRAWGGHQLLGRDVRAELIAEGIDPAAVNGEPDSSIGPEPFSDELGSQKSCATDAECAAPEYCPADTHKCERPIPAVISPFMLELYNTAIAPSHGLPKLGRLLAGAMRGFTFTAELGASFFGGPPSKIPPRTRRVMLVGVADHAARLALSLPLGTVERYNALYAGPAAAQHLSSVVLELSPGADVARIAGRVRQMGYEIADSGAERIGLALTLLTLLFSLISAAIVGLATINIAHGFFRQVAERKREIGVLRAVGASAGDVERVLPAEAGAIGLCGGAVGLALAWLSALGCDRLAARLLPDFPFKPDSFFSFGWQLIVGALLCAIFACMAGALWPARAAARLEPTEALSSP